MELRVLRYFLAVAREQNITRAAEVLHITQPTLSRQLMQLEEEIQKPLFDRGKGKITLTNEGMLLRRRAEEMIELADRTKQELQSEEEALSGELHIGSGESERFRGISHVIKEFSLQHPKVQYRLFSGNADDIKEKLDSGVLDIALLNEPVEIDNYEFIRIPEKDRWGILLPKHDPLAQKEAISPSDLISASLILSPRMLVHHEIENWFGPVFEQVKEVASVNLIHNATMLVEDGIGYAITLEHLVKDSAESPICFKPFVPTLETGCVLVWKKYQVFSPLIKEFLRHLKHAYQA